MTVRASDYPDLRHSRLNKLMERFTNPPSLKLIEMFGEDNWESDNIKWETQVGNRGLAPFASPGSPADTTSPQGVGAGAAFAAYWKEKMFFGEEFLNNLREPGTGRYMSAQKHLAKGMKGLKNRNSRRKEWLLAKMLTGASFTYLVQNGLKYTIDYDVPSDQVVTLGASRKWSTGDSRNIVEDLFDVNLTTQNANGFSMTNAMCTTEVLKTMVLDPSIQTLLQKSAYGDGDLYTNPVAVLQNLLNIPLFMVYDQIYQVRAWLTAAVTGGSTTTVYVDNPTDFEVGDTLYFYDVSAETKEAETISSIDVNAGTITVATAPSTSYIAQEDFVYANKKFIPATKFVMFNPNVDGEKSAEFANAPYGLGRKFGMQTDIWEDKDPDGVFVRVQNKGIPVLYQKDSIYTLTVR